MAGIARFRYRPTLYEKDKPVNKIQIRKTETIRLTSAAQPLYAGECSTAPVAA